ncbi:hypothetical protein Dda_1420 [Drechslerella dactyloides]|uniref:DUF7587 domain-containing protein n=1 Tax=Drechslerella dactyloides TaxID=74499 RepID=A0AAD6J1R1_DREDA|nr:hypothetical protein Dda_1420 [Drechslerella dactyloides]
MANNIAFPVMHPEEIPDYLYRVHVSGRSRTIYYFDEGFSCTALGRINIRNYGQLFTAVNNHLDWRCDAPSHLISTFDDRKHALNWAGKYLDRFPGAEAHLMKIDTDEIKNSVGRRIPIIHAGDIVDQYPEMRPNHVHRKYLNHEVLVLYKIPADAIVAATPI